jgi:predicted protein tyrosine phosphatase
MRRILFVCSRNKLRSPTAEAVFREEARAEVDSAGLNNDAEVPLTGEQVQWADTILLMEEAHRRRLKQKFAGLLKGKRVEVLGIPDVYGYLDERLVKLLRERCERYMS